MGPAAEAARDLLRDVPPLTAYEQVVWNGYWDLSTTRPSSMSGCPRIPFDKIVQYSDMFEMPRSMAELFYFHVTALDQHYAARINREQKARSK